jgi:dipeptide/tripeptide permease
VFGLDGMAYYGILPLMKAFLGQDIGIRPELASTWVSLFSAAFSVAMLVAGRAAERRLGIRRSILLALGLLAVGRILYSGAPHVGGAALVALALGVVALGEGVLQPVCYAAVKRFTSADTSSMGFALLYAALNLGAMLMGLVSAKVRTTFDVAYHAKESSVSGFEAVAWFCTAVTLLTLVVFAVGMKPNGDADVVPGNDSAAATHGRRAPHRDVRFLFFIFCFVPVRTLFAHQWLTMPEYVLRSYPPAVSDRMEWLVDSINPLVILIGVPTLTAITRRYSVMTMMIAGTLLSAASTFLLVPAPHAATLIAYFLVFSIGEALWSSRFYEHAAGLAPEGRVAEYMGVAMLPWFVVQSTTGLYSGWVLEAFLPKAGPARPGSMWLLYGAAALITPAALFLARRWIGRGLASIDAPTVT